MFKLNESLLLLPAEFIRVLVLGRQRYRAGAYAGFCSMKRLGAFLLLLGWDASPSQGYCSYKFAGTHLHTWVERGTVRDIYVCYPRTLQHNVSCQGRVVQRKQTQD